MIPVPDLRRRPWIVRMRWADLLFAHWPLPPSSLRALVPPTLELETFDGQAWLGIVPFRMADVGLRGLPSVPRLGAFAEVNVRTYVRHRGRSGVWFLSLDAASRPTVEGARAFFHLPYLRADMSVELDGEAVEFRSRRADPRGRPAHIDIRYRPTGRPERAAPGTLEAWLTDRLRVFSVDREGRVRRTEVQHAAWQLQPAEAQLRSESVALALDITLPPVAPHLRFSRSLDVRAWLPRPV